jgi:hypothetical protein
MTDKPGQTSSQSSSSADVEMKPDHPGASGPEPTDLLETGAPVRSGPSGSAPAASGVLTASSARSAGPAVVQNSADKIVITVAPFTGGPFSVTANKRDSVEDLKKVVAKKLKVLKERICLLYRERCLYIHSTMNFS